ncbi:transposase [Spirosoma sp.]|uniref:transposase n=1 Tax=Spirosoma sp. TaxID=1899569 RepID=UPI003B3B38A7
MKHKAIRYNAEFREKVLSELRTGKSVRKVAKQFGISPLTLKRWQQLNGIQAHNVKTTMPPTNWQETEDELQRKIQRLEEEKRVLKEALHILLRT